MKRKTKHKIGWIMFLTGLIGNIAYYIGFQGILFSLIASTPIMLTLIIGGIYLIWKNEFTPEQKKEYKQKYKQNTK